MVVLLAFSYIGDVVQVSAVSIARTLSIRPEGAPSGPLWSPLEDIVAISYPSLGIDSRTALTDILHMYSHVFPALGVLVTGHIHVVHHEIIANDARPICWGTRRLAPTGLWTEQDCVWDMLDGGQIEQIDSPWASRVVLIRCVCWVNSSGYWLEAISPNASQKVAFVTNEGLFQFGVIPFGLCNAPATFERLMDRVLPVRCMVYLDDVISFVTDAPEAMLRLTEVLERLSSFGSTAES